ncbi:SDR family oxidoreductase [Streptomyces sp. NPDC048506]|uniref:SDR family oxidoreductase n=1 Tax=Streptomyces sp. NPDC048506 TaxID=3155028 RepID=UPI00341D2CD5
MRRTHVITGATGLIGAALVLELAPHPDTGAIICPVRAGDGDGHARLTAALTTAARAYRTDADTVAQALRLVTAVAADLTRPGLGLDPARLRTAGPLWFWHVGALVGFGRANRRRPFATNTAGTRRTVTLAAQLDAEAFHYVSTVYVAGHRQGEIPEEPITTPTPRECYEASKIAAERIVWNAPLPTRIYRPTAVIGHHTTLACGGPYSGVYGMMRRIALHHALRPGLDGGHHPVRLLAHPELPINLVPVDHVTRELVDIAHATTRHRVFHLSNPTPPTVGATLGAIFGQLGIADYELVPDPVRLRAPDLHLAHLLHEFYSAYLTHDQRFRRDHTRAALTHPDCSRYPMDDALLNRFFAHYHRHELARRHRTDAVPGPA